MKAKDSKNDLIDLDADYYAQHSSTQNSLANEILDAYPLTSCMHILDVGCGDGRITADLAKRVPKGKVLGIDASANMIEFAVKNFPKEEFPNLNFLQVKAENAVFPQQFDLIVSFFCFHWLTDPELAIKRLSYSLKPSGEMLILTCPKESPYYHYMEKALQKYPKYYPSSANHNMCSAKAYKDILSKNGLDIVDFQEHNSHVLYNSLKEVREYIRGWLNSYVLLPDDLQNAFLHDVSQLVEEDPTTHREEQFAIPYTVLFIKARKK
jgi:trans-aconitate methyltransferase